MKSHEGFLYVIEHKCVALQHDGNFGAPSLMALVCFIFSISAPFFHVAFPAHRISQRCGAGAGGLTARHLIFRLRSIKPRGSRHLMKIMTFSNMSATVTFSQCSLRDGVQSLARLEVYDVWMLQIFILLIFLFP